MRSLLLALVACGGTSAATPADARCSDASTCGTACEASFAGNFAETSYRDANCPSAGSALTFAIPSATIGGDLAVSIAVGGPGTYSSETVAAWTAVAARSIGDGGCVYSAGSDIVPTGSFTLDLQAGGSAPHGTLDLVLFVHALQASDCGPASNEAIEVVF
ncbi:MAG TPA: hypothetical protein VH143_33535 [Kofleriaceae bacterium]|jgi:hypothetical protein|nr:hypothetical protein [Kofleriaceae bacterium]